MKDMQNGSKHTPGPWHAEPYVTTMKESVYAVFCERADPDGVFIGTAGSQPESKANAQLIAAAPDLLNACKLVLRGIGDGSVDVFDVETALQTAIAKAEGRSDG